MAFSTPRPMRLLQTTTVAVFAVTVSARPAVAADPAPASSAPTTPAPASAVVATDGTDPGPEASSSHGPIVLGVSLGVAGLVGIGVGSVFGLLASSSWNNAKSDCGPSQNPGHCVTQNPSQATSDHDAAVTNADVSTVAFIAGGVLLTAGVTVLLTTLHHGGAKASEVAVAPAVGPGQAGLALRGSF